MEFALQISVPCFNWLGKAKGDKQGDITSLSAHPLIILGSEKKSQRKYRKAGLTGLHMG